MSCTPHYCSQEFPKYYEDSWLTKVPDKLISELSIPGTHDSGCRNHLAFCQTQSYSITTQLKGGIRFLDIRCRHIKNVFAIHHGLVYCGLMFGDVLNECKNFLDENPGEAIIMRVQEEYNEKECTRSFQETFRYYYTAYEDYISLTSDIPMLNQIRKKIWIMPNFSYDQGFYWSRANIQDNYKLESESDIEKKVEEIKNQIEKSKTGSSNTLYINFCSGVGYLHWPYSIAEKTNKVPMDLSGRMGIVPMDFPGEDAIQHIIKQNFNF
jgi:1-phosphatidylinositol phosphodiesterase